MELKVPTIDCVKKPTRKRTNKPFKMETLYLWISKDGKEVRKAIKDITPAEFIQWAGSVAPFFEDMIQEHQVSTTKDREKYFSVIVQFLHSLKLGKEMFD